MKREAQKYRKTFFIKVKKKKCKRKRRNTGKGDETKLAFGLQLYHFLCAYFKLRL